MHTSVLQRASAATLGLAMVLLSGSLFADAFQPIEYRGTLPVVKFDKSPPLRSIPPVPIPANLGQWGGAMVDEDGTDGPIVYGPQTPDEALQSQVPSGDIPAPSVTFDGMPNISGVSPPDPTGDIGPDHYVLMSNLAFEIYDRAGNSEFGPAANNTLWSGFGGQCESQNAGDPIVLYDQFADRWLLTQFTSSAEPGTGDYFNCVAVSQTSDPTGPWYRWQINNGTNFPDYPKYGVGEEAYFISTRDFGPGEVGHGAFALERSALIAGDPNPTVISFFAPLEPATDENLGDGILPMDIDGFEFPPVNSPHYYIGSMDDGGGLNAAQDALSIWEFVADFDTPGNSTFTFTGFVPIAPFDTIYAPCGGSRSCIEQPGTGNRVDHQGYRQRPIHRAAYRNFGTHESIVTNQSVEASPTVAGIRWWELRNPGTAPAIFQEGTYAPGLSDGIQRWFGSIAQDSAGNMGLGYSVSDGTSVFPGIRYTGRLSSDPLGTMAQGEGTIVDGAGSQTSSQRWGDYSSMNVDPIDDCTFWYTTQYMPSTSGNGWQLHVGAFTFDECGTPDYWMSVSSRTQIPICQGDDAEYDLKISSISGFSNSVTLSASGNPGATTTSFSGNPVTPTADSTFTIGNTGGLAPGQYFTDIMATSGGFDDRFATVGFEVVPSSPAAPDLTSPPDMAVDLSQNPVLMWTDTGAPEYLVEVASDSGFTNIVFTEMVSTNQVTVGTPLATNTTFYWRVSSSNICGASTPSEVFSFTTATLFGDCPAGQAPVVALNFDFEDGAQGFTSGSNVGTNTWTLTTVNPASGTQHWRTDDNSTTSDTFLSSPVLSIPGGLTNLTLRFNNAQMFEPGPTPTECWDGGILEVSTNGGGAFTQISNTDMVNDLYDGTLRSTGSNPLGGAEAWCDSEQPYTDARVDITALAGQDDVVFRFRVGTDGSVGGEGWDIDDVRVQGCSALLDFENGFENLEK